jgi:hypothetical protein
MTHQVMLKAFQITLIAFVTGSFLFGCAKKDMVPDEDPTLDASNDSIDYSEISQSSIYEISVFREKKMKSY